MNPIIVGLVTVGLLAALVGGAMAVGTFGLLKHQYEVSGVFSDAAGLHKGAGVRLAGVEVGQVTGVSPDFAHGQVLITWKVDHGVHLGPRTRADIGTATLLGGDVVKLSDTSGGRSLERVPHDQRRIPISRTSVPYTVTAALGDLTTNLEQIKIPVVDKLLKQVSANVSSTAPQLPDLLKNLDLVAKAVTSRQQQLSELLTNSQQITSTLATRDQELVQLIDRADKLLDVLNGQRDQLASALGSSSNIVRQLGDLLTTKRAQIDSILGDLHRTLDVAQRQVPNINKGLSYAAPTFERLVAASSPKAFRV
jgi:phospholipid/cholesterol/gamma-HCH transport system substrate-binding protein